MVCFREENTGPLSIFADGKTGCLNCFKRIDIKRKKAGKDKLKQMKTKRRKKMWTYFAPAERADEKTLSFEIDLVSRNPVMSGLLHSVNGVLGVLNEQRQLLALNDSFLQILGVSDPQKCLGLRPGEALNCIHAHEEPGGCGTSKFCSSCGAAIAIVSSLGQDRPVERMCALTAQKDGGTVNLALLIKSHPLIIHGKRFLLLFIQDITRSQKRAALERTFFHDINNMLNVLLGSAELLVRENPSALAETVRDAALRLQKETAVQRCLMESDSYGYPLERQKVKAAHILDDLRTFFADHPTAYGKKMEIRDAHAGVSIRTDKALLLRVLNNMIINAFEASGEHGTIKIWLERNEDFLTFCVWNEQNIPYEAVNRIFQRNFSTKKQDGRGIGAFSMKLLGEKILGGEVSFKSSREDGTVFRFAHLL